MSLETFKEIMPDLEFSIAYNVWLKLDKELKYDALVAMLKSSHTVALSLIIRNWVETTCSKIAFYNLPDCVKTIDLSKFIKH